MEVSVSFAGDDEDEEYYTSIGYIADCWIDEDGAGDKSGKAYYPASGVEITGEIIVRYEITPWISRFEIDGIKPLETDDAEQSSTEKDGNSPNPNDR